MILRSRRVVWALIVSWRWRRRRIGSLDFSVASLILVAVFWWWWGAGRGWNGTSVACLVTISFRTGSLRRDIGDNWAPLTTLRCARLQVLLTIFPLRWILLHLWHLLRWLLSVILRRLGV